MKHYFFRKVYWEAFFIVRFHEAECSPIYAYGWWKSRLSLIKKGHI